MRNDKLDSKSFFLSFFLSLVLETQLNHFTKELKVLNFHRFATQSVLISSVAISSTSAWLNCSYWNRFNEGGISLICTPCYLGIC